MTCAPEFGASFVPSDQATVCTGRDIVFQIDRPTAGASMIPLPTRRRTAVLNQRQHDRSIRLVRRAETSREARKDAVPIEGLNQNVATKNVGGGIRDVCSQRLRRTRRCYFPVLVAFFLAAFFEEVFVAPAADFADVFAASLATSTACRTDRP